MHENEFDRIIRGKLSELESPVPDGTWEKILDRKRRRFLFILAGGTVLLLAIWLVFVNLPELKNIAFGVEQPANVSSRPWLHPDTARESVSAKSPASPFQRANQIFTRHESQHHRKDHITTPPRLETAVDNLQDSGSPGIHQSSTPEMTIKVESANASDSSVSGGQKRIDNDADTVTFSVSVSEPVNISHDKFSLEIFVSPFLPLNNVTAIDKSYQDLLRSSSVMQMSVGAGFRLKYHISRQWWSSIGLLVTNTRADIKFTDASGVLQQSANKYSALTVPLLVSYHPRHFRKTRLSFTTGLNLQFYSRYRGIIPGAQQQIIDIGQTNVFSRNAKPTWYLSTNISGNLFRKSELFLEPWVTLPMSSMSKDFFGFRQRISGIGVSVGARKKLF